MKIIYSGGWNNENQESIHQCFLYSYQNGILKMRQNGKKVALVTLAKPDGYYDDVIRSLYGDIEIINTASPNPDWSSYDGIFIPGGDTIVLKNRLQEFNFSLGALKDSVMLLGDSAGAKILAPFFFLSPKGERRGIDIEFIEGLHPQAGCIVIPHANNPLHCNDILLSKIEAYAHSKGIGVLTLNENEQKLFQGEAFVDVDINDLFVL